MFTSFPTQGHHVVYMCPDVIFQILLLCSRPMTSHHVTCHVTAMSCASSLSLKEKEKEIQKKRNIKSRKIDKRKRKMLVSKVFHNSTPLLRFRFQRNFFFVPPDPLTPLLIFLILFQTFFQFLYLLLLLFFSIVLPPIPISLQFFQIFFVKFLIVPSI